MTTRDLEALSDVELVDVSLRDRQGRVGAQAASVLLQRYQDRVYVWCYRLVRDHNRALDMAQDTMLNAYRRLESFHGRSGFASWLFMIARNRCLSAIRAASRRGGKEELRDDLADPAPSPDELLEWRLDEEATLDLIERCLDPLEQEALWLRCFEGLPVEEITRLLHIDAATGARSVLQRARRKLLAARNASPVSERGAPSGYTRSERRR